MAGFFYMKNFLITKAIPNQIPEVIIPIHDIRFSFTGNHFFCSTKPIKTICNDMGTYSKNAHNEFKTFTSHNALTSLTRLPLRDFTIVRIKTINPKIEIAVVKVRITVTFSIILPEYFLLVAWLVLCDRPYLFHHEYYRQVLNQGFHFLFSQ